MGIGDWGLGIGDWGLGIGPNPQSPIPNPQSPIPNPQLNIIHLSKILIIKNYILNILNCKYIYYIYKNFTSNYKIYAFFGWY